MKIFKYEVFGSIGAINEGDADDKIRLSLGNVANIRRIELIGGKGEYVGTNNK